MRIKNEAVAANVLALAVIFLGLIGGNAVFGQSTKQWNVIKSSKGELTVSLPPGAIVVNENKEPHLYANLDGVYFTVAKREVGNPKEYVKKIASPNPNTKSDLSQFNGFLVQRLMRDDEKRYAEYLYIGSSNSYFEISVSAKTRDSSLLIRFLGSIQLSGKPLFLYSSSNPQVTSTPLVLEDLRSSQIVKEFLKKPDNNSTRPTFGQVADMLPFDTTEYSQPLIILRKVKIQTPDIENPPTRTSVLRAMVTFLKNGEVGSFTIDPSLGKPYAEAAARSIRKFKFILAEVDGKPVDMTRLIEYTVLLK